MNNKNSNTKLNNIEINTFHPFKRFLAYEIDGIIFAFIAIILFLLIEFSSSSNQSKNFIFSFYIYCYVYFVFLIHCFKTTPGKKFFGIKVVDAETKKNISISTSSKKYCLVCVLTSWCLKPISYISIAEFIKPKYLQNFCMIYLFIFCIIPAIILINSFFYYKKHLITRIDEKLNIVIIYERVNLLNPYRIVLICLMILFIFLMYFGISSIQ